MKKLLFISVGLLAVLGSIAQGRNTVTLSINNNRSYGARVNIDGTSYPLTSSGNKLTAIISDLRPGQHTLQITNNRSNYRMSDVTTTFTLRNRFDMRINLNDDGSLELLESMRYRNNNNSYSRISNQEYNNLYSNVRIQRTPEQRRAMIASAFSGAGDRNYYFTSAQVAQLLQWVPSEGDRLQLAKQAYPRVTDPGGFTRVELLFNNQTNRDELATYMLNYNNNSEVAYDNSNVVVVSNAAISDASYNSIYNDIRAQWPAATQYNSLYSVFSNTNNYFTTAQAIQLIQLTNSESNRLTLAKLAYRGIVDPVNYTQAYNLFSTNSSRTELAAYINNYRPGTTVYSNAHPAMAEYDFNNLMQDVRSRFMPFEKMTTLTGIFNNSNYYFTSDQAKQLIGLVSSESNRLQLAKSSYARIVDRSNFRTIYDLLDSRQSRDELDVYVSSYRE